jgi:hypothetical protein
MMAAVGCARSAPTSPDGPSTSRTTSRVTWLTAVSPQAATGGPRSTAVVNGFRVHPDPGDDGVIHAFEGEKVVVNATDIASRPPAPQSYLVVEWGDGPNQRVGCGPCRADHSYAPGRYTLVASADNLQPSAGSGTDRSISVVVDVEPQRDLAPIQPFQLSASDIGVGESTFLLVPFFLPDGVELSSVPFLDCSPPGAAFLDFGNEVFMGPNVAVPFVGVSPGTCTFAVSGGVNGVPFIQTVRFTVH